MIRELLAEAGHSVGAGESGREGDRSLDRGDDAGELPRLARADRFVNGPIAAGTHDFGSPGRAAGRTTSPTAAAGRSSRSRRPPRAARSTLSFGARRVYLVLGSPGQSRRVRVLLDGRPIPDRLAGADVHNGVVTVTGAAALRPGRPAEGRRPHAAPRPRTGGDGLCLHLRLMQAAPGRGNGTRPYPILWVPWEQRRRRLIISPWHRAGRRRRADDRRGRQPLHRARRLRGAQRRRRPRGGAARRSLPARPGRARRDAAGLRRDRGDAAAARGRGRAHAR